jgi:hypothetical protein
MPSGGEPVAAIGRATEVFLGHLPSIGDVTMIEISTRAEGEDAIKWTGELDARRVAQRLEAHPDTTCLKVRCDLRGVGADDRDLVIPDGMLFWSQLAELTSPPDEPIEITISLNTDVYVATSWGDVRDNRALAGRNAPRFNAFLAQFVGNTGATVDQYSADDYDGQVAITGIRLPPLGMQ